MQVSENYTLLIDKINTFIKKYYLNKILRGLLFLGAGLFSAYVVFTLSEYFGNFNTTFRTILFYAFILLNLGLIAGLIIPPLMAYLKLGKSLSHDQAAQIIGEHFGDIKDKLLNTLQLKKLGDEEVQNSALIRASIDQKIVALKPVRFPSAINIRENRRYIKWVLFPLGVICIIGFAAPSILTESTKRLIRHNEYFKPVAPFEFNVQNKNLSVVQGEDLNLAVKLTGNGLPADVYVETASNTFKLDKENTTRFHYLFTNIQQNTTFKLVGNGFESEPYEIRVNLRPSLLHFDVELNYPAYLHKKNETLPNAGDLTIPVGTTVSWKFHTQNATGLLFFMNSVASPVQAGDKDLFEHRERILKNSVYKVAPINNLVNHADSALYRVNVIEDEAPSIVVSEKPDSISMSTIYFNGKIQDDHGFSDLSFHYTIGDPQDKAHQQNFTKKVKADLSQTLTDFFYLWSMKDLGIKPGDQVTYYFEVADNDGVNGPKKTKSSEHTINIPDQKAIDAQLNASAETIKQQMQSASKLAGEIEKQSQKLNQLLLNKNSLSFDEKKQIQDLLQKRQELEALVKQIQQENQKNSYNRLESGQQSQEMQQKQSLMDQLLNNALDPKTREMLQRLQEMLQNDQKESTRQELQKMQNDGKSSKRELDRMLELYKKLEFQQKLNQNIAELNKLADKQDKLAEQTDPNNTDKNKQQPNDKHNPQNANKDKLTEENKAQQDAYKAKQDAANKANQQNADQKAKQDAIDKLKQEIADKQKQQQAATDKAKQDEANKANQQNADKNQQQNTDKNQQQSAADKALQDAINKLKQELADKLKQQQADKADQQNGDKNQQNAGQNKQGDQQQKDQNGQQQKGDQSKQQGDNKDQQQAGQDQQQQKSQEELQKEQDELNKEFEDLKKALEDMKKNDEEQAKKQDFEEPKQDEQQIEQQMQESSNQLSKKENQKASKSQKQSSKQMRQMAQKMQQQEQDEEDKQNEVDEDQLRQLLKSLVNSSFKEEKNMQDLRAMSTSDPNYIPLAQVQKSIKDNLKTAEDTLYSLSKRIPQIQSTVNREVEAINSHIDDALQNLGDRRTPQANANQQYAMTSMNNLALMLADALNNMQQSQSSKSSKSSKSKKRQSMSELAKRQEQLNQNMQRAAQQLKQQQQQGGNQNQSQRQQMSEQLAKLAREQEEIRQQMQQMQIEENKSGARTMPDAEKTLQQMEQTEKDIVNRSISEESLKRQQQIQIRLLEYEKAEQEREQEQQRQSNAGKDMPPGFIKALQDYQQAKAKQTEQVKTVPPALNLYYKQKIKTYFDQLNAK